MKRNSIRIFSLLLAVLLVFSIVPHEVDAAPSSSKITTTPTGYTSASDVIYQTGTVNGKQIIKNWGARGETCVFLSSKAASFYTGSNTFANFSQMSGSNKQNSVPSSELFLALQSFMTSQHNFYTYYDGNKNVRNFYKYTDCVSSDTSTVALFYRGGLVSSTWDSGNTWNQEHCWPQSKLNNSEQIGDIMHLRPSNPSENSSRGNTPYGTGSSYYDPGVSVRGDCARIVLYMYVRYGLSSKMWGTSGVIQSIDVLLAWMEEDPVDTWEMGRNDSIQSITGTRNVFIDYPELAFILFGREVPSDMTTPSGNAGSGSYTPPTCQHTNTEIRAAKQVSCTEDGYTGDTYCKDCGAKLSSGTAIKATGHKDTNNDGQCDTCGTSLNCTHSETEIRGEKEATCSQEGYSGDTYCKDCNVQIRAGEVIPKTPHTEVVEGAREATCIDEGATGTTICSVCNTTLKANEPIPATGEHTFGEWTVTTEPTETETGTREHTCLVCDHTETEEIPVIVPVEDPTVSPTDPSVAPTEPNDDKDEEPDAPFPGIWIVLAIAVAVGGCVVIVILILKKKKEKE